MIAGIDVNNRGMRLSLVDMHLGIADNPGWAFASQGRMRIAIGATVVREAYRQKISSF